MLNRTFITAALVATLCVSLARPAEADGEILLTHARALAGNVTPGDAPGYPITLSIPGKFELASNLFVAADRIGIQVTHTNVTIDLNGFLMEGSNVAWYGIAGGVNGVTVRNGTIANFEFDGIVSDGERWVVDEMQIDGNGRHGADLRGNNSRYHRITNSIVSDNGEDGIRCRHCVISGNVVTENGNFGMNSIGTIIGNHIYLNGNYGLILGAGNSGFAHNVLTSNNGGTGEDQVADAIPIHTNLCNGIDC